MRYTLSDQEFTFFSQMVYRINSSSSYEEAADTLLRQLQYIIPFTKGIVFQICETAPGQPPAYQHPVVLNPPGLVYEEDIFMKGGYRSDWLMYSNSPWSRTFLQTDIRDEDTFRDSSLYQNVYLPQNIFYGLHTILVHRDRKLAQVNLFRPEDQTDFDERDVFIFSALSPHLEQKLYSLLEHPPICDNCPGQECRSFQDNEFQFHMMSTYGLTKREIEVCLLLCQGMSNQEITVSLFISKSTLDKHLYNIYRKTSVKNRVQLVRLFDQESARFGAPPRGPSGGVRP